MATIFSYAGALHIVTKYCKDGQLADRIRVAYNQTFLDLDTPMVNNKDIKAMEQLGWRIAMGNEFQGVKSWVRS